MKPWQVCSLELAKELKALGVRQESAFYWCPLKPDLKYYAVFRPNFWEPSPAKKGCGYNRSECFAAFTVAELGCILPGNAYTRQHPSGDCFVCFWDGVKEFSISGDTEADARAKMLCYLLENKIITVDEVNKRLREGV